MLKVKSRVARLMKLTIVYDAELKTKRYVTMPTPFGSLPLKIRTGPMIIKGNDRNRNGETDQLSTTQGVSISIGVQSELDASLD